MSQQWLSIVEYARNHNVSDMTVRRRIKNGKLRAELRDGKYYIPSEGAESEHQLSGVSEQSPEKLSAASSLPSHDNYRSGLAERGIPAPKARISRPDMDRHTPYHSEPPPAVPRPQSLRSESPASGLNLHGRSEIAEFIKVYRDALARIEKQEQLLEQRWQSKMQACEAIIAKKDFELKKLRQDVEDLQLLVGIFESAKPA